MSDQAGDITMDVSSTSTSGQGPILSRRTALIGGSAVLGGELISLSTPPNNATAAAALPRIILGGTSLGYFDEGHTAAGMWTMPSTLSVHASPLELQRAVISVTWDSRMADVTSSEIIIASDDTTAIVEAVVSPGSIQFAWPSTVKRKSQQRYFECILPIRGKPLFPNDGLSGVVPGQASLDLRNRRTPIVVSTDGQDAAVHGEVWGASISALGASFEDGGNASYARVVRIESTGPGAIPAGSALVLAVDSARVSAMYALTRALQIELGISPTSNNFGSGTMSAFTSQVGQISASTTNLRIISLLQCALWCKGYPGGTIGSGWTATIAGSVTAVRSDMGLSTATSAVTGKMLKSLFTMDAYVLLNGGSTAIRDGQRWLNQKYSSRRDFYIIPCDGLFTRQMQQGVVFAIQYELGMADGVANGNLGPATSAELTSKGQVQLGNVDTLKNFVKLFQLALSCNAYDVTLDGDFGASTHSKVVSFQNFMEISVSGKGDFGTWAALLVSTGDPNRPVSGIDTTSTMTPAFATQMRNAGYNVVGRYLTVDGKSIRPGELDTIFNAGFSLIPIFQNFNNAASYFTTAIGYDHGRQAAIRARQLGLKGGVTIFFAVDYDATGDEARSIVLDYFDGIRTGLNRSVLVHYEIGVYATRNVASIVYDAGRATGVWVSGMSTGYSGNLGFKMPSQWMYNQIQELTTINIDRNAVSHRAQPETRGDVALTPVNGNDFDRFYWTVVEKQIVAESIIHDFPNLPQAYASQMMMFWLQKDAYDSMAWQIYTPFPEVVLGYPGGINYGHARVRFFDEAGSRATIVSQYQAGESVKHMAATAHGVYNWGDSAGQSTMEIGDLGGWALDFVQFWATYDLSGRQQSIASWVPANLGGSAASPSAKLITGIKSAFEGGWPWPNFPRDQFMKYNDVQAAEPTGAELTAFATASAARLISLAGL